jgi:hypothetical protein
VVLASEGDTRLKAVPYRSSGAMTWRMGHHFLFAAAPGHPAAAFTPLPQTLPLPTPDSWMAQLRAATWVILR